MRRAALLLAALAAALAVAGPAAASELHPTQAELEAELICPACHSSLDVSESAIAQQMKDYIRKRIAEGATKSQIVNELVDQLGPGVLGVPRKHGFDLLAWVLPIGGILLGAAGLGAGAWYWSRVRAAGGGPGASEPALDPALERRLDAELERFEL